MKFLSDIFNAFFTRWRKPKPLPTFETLGYGPASLDVYRPDGALASDKRSAIVLVHGGGFIDGDKANPGVADIKSGYYCAKGDVFVSINYRLDVAPHVQAQDVAAAVAFVKKLPGVDPARVVLMAHSAGATDAALAVTSDLCDVERVVLLDPASLDAVETMDHPHDPVFDPLGATREEWEENSPIAHLSGPIPPTLIVVSGDRGKTFMQQVQAFVDLAKHYGCPDVQVEPFPDLSHEECNKLVGTDCGLTRAIDAFLA